MKCKRPSGGVRRSAPDAWRGRLDWPGGPLSRIGLRSGEIRKDHPITLDERFLTHGAVGRAGGGQNDGWNTGRRFTEPVIEPSGCLSGGKTARIGAFLISPAISLPSGSRMLASPAPSMLQRASTSQRAMRCRRAKARRALLSAGGSSPKRAASAGQKRFCGCR